MSDESLVLAAIPRAVLDSIGEGITLADASGRIVFSNREASRILGVPPSEQGPENWAQHYGVFLPDEHTPFPTDRYPLLRALKGEATDGVEMFIRNPNVPEGVLISVTGRPLRAAAGTGQGPIIGATVIFRDITKARRNEIDLRRSNAALRLAQDRQAELTALVVHDLKSPLSSILTGLELEQEHDLTVEEARDNRTRTYEAARVMHRMVLDLLDVHLAEDGALVPAIEEIDVGILMGEVEGAMLARLKRRGQRLVVAKPEPNLAIAADRELVRRILQNLLDNCIKYGPSGGTIWLDADGSPAGQVILRVRDEGPGVPTEAREQIFEKYARVERGQASALPRESRGLGLRFCRLAVEVHGGRIWVEDNTPRGASFCVALPRAAP